MAGKSSAYKIRQAVGDKGTSQTPLIYKMKRSGPRIEPCGTPEVTGRDEKEAPETTTCWEQ